MIKQIIVPVDYSVSSHHAYLYARALGAAIGASVKVVHVFYGSFNSTDPLVIKEAKGRREILESQMEDFVNLVPEPYQGDTMTKLKIETEVIHGPVINTLIKLSESGENVMFVMGKTGEHDSLDKIFGSVSATVAQQAHCPVMLIPRGTDYKDFAKILYASNFESAKKEIIDQVVKFANLFRSAIHFVHVSELGESENYTATKERIFEGLFEKGNPGFSFSMATTRGSSVSKALSDYAAQHDMDLMVLINRDRGIVQNLLGMSTTKKLAMYGSLPLLVFHM